MAEKDEDGPSLELPSFGFGRKRKPKQSPPPSEPEPPAEEPTAAAPPLYVDEEVEEVEEVEEQPTAVDVEPVPAPGPDEPKAAKEPRKVTLPPISGMAAAIVTGVVVGAATVGLIRAAFGLCEALRGAPSCGDPGFLLLAAIMVAMVLLGSFLLRAWQVPDPGSTSFLAVGLMAVIALLFLVDVLFDWWMIIAIPVISALTFALSHWVTTSLIEPAKD